MSEELARAFHEAYERLAPSFGYETRKASAVPWEQVPEQNRNLMIAVAGEIESCVAERCAPLVDALERIEKNLFTMYSEWPRDVARLALARFREGGDGGR